MKYFYSKNDDFLSLSPPRLDITRNHNLDEVKSMDNKITITHIK